MTIINWHWRVFIRKPWPPVRFTRRIPHALHNGSALTIGPYEFIWGPGA